MKRERRMNNKKREKEESRENINGTKIEKNNEQHKEKRVEKDGTKNRD